MFSKIDPPYRTKDEDFHFFITVENGEHSYLTVPAPLSSLAFPIISFITITFNENLALNIISLYY